jgi:hypothetical protein
MIRLDIQFLRSRVRRVRDLPWRARLHSGPQPRSTLHSSDDATFGRHGRPPRRSAGDVSDQRSLPRARHGSSSRPHCAGGRGPSTNSAARVLTILLGYLVNPIDSSIRRTIGSPSTKCYDFSRSLIVTSNSSFVRRPPEPLPSQNKIHVSVEENHPNQEHELRRRRVPRRRPRADWFERSAQSSL